MKRSSLVLLLACGCSTTQPPAPTAPTPSAFSLPALQGYAADARAGRFGRLDHLIVLQHGETLIDVAFDSPPRQTPTTPFDQAIYDYDDSRWHPYYADTDLHTMQSMTKSVVSMLIGAAIDDGLISDTKAPVTRWFPATPDTEGLRLSVVGALPRARGAFHLRREWVRGAVHDHRTRPRCCGRSQCMEPPHHT